MSGIAVCNVPGYCVEEVADSTLCMILNLYRRVHFLAHKFSTLATSDDQDDRRKLALAPEQLRDSTYPCPRIRNQVLGLVGLGERWHSFTPAQI